MASVCNRFTMHPRRSITEREITEALNDSEFDYSGDDSDDDPEFHPPVFDQKTSKRESESSSSDEDEHPLFTPTASPVLSDNSELAPTRFKGCARARGRSRGRGVTLSVRQAALRNRQNNVDTQDTWVHDTLDSEINNLMQPAYFQKNTEEWEWYHFYEQYIDENILKIIVDCTNRTHVMKTGKSMGLTLKELKVYIGITMIMAALQYPKISMYWSKNWKVPIIAMAMTRNRFFFIRLRLKCVYDPDVTSEQKLQKIWKIQPLFDHILRRCFEQDRPQELSIDEMIIPFTGKCSMRQYCPNKPNPVGLKVFVLASPQGVVCDMVVYEGDTTFPHLTSQGKVNIACFL